MSEDVLVRARVKGWFTNSNPSGRDRDESNPDNVLPADRWVMPDDWSRVIAGTSDPDVAYDRRPAYDYMFNPGSGIALGEPWGFSSNETGAFVTYDRPFVGPYSLVDVAMRGVGVAPYLGQVGEDEPDFRDTSLGDGQVDWWDAPMPVCRRAVRHPRQRLHQGSPQEGRLLRPARPTARQVYPNPYYYSMIPGPPGHPGPRGRRWLRVGFVERRRRLPVLERRSTSRPGPSTATSTAAAPLSSAKSVTSTAMTPSTARSRSTATTTVRPSWPPTATSTSTTPTAM
ncbi:MAG: hypothetical protein U5Q44_04835 [Dehalococcoidia bacterium]|nr:hypothetical protein [Dehalococcoidia bacterium]